MSDTMTPSAETLVDHSGLPADLRLEMLVGKMADALAAIRPLADELHLRANASATSRRRLDFLVELEGARCERLGELLDEVQAFRREMAATV